MSKLERPLLHQFNEHLKPLPPPSKDTDTGKKKGGAIVCLFITWLL